jgi:hypothetical protein
MLNQVKAHQKKLHGLVRAEKNSDNFVNICFTAGLGFSSDHDTSFKV